MIAFESWSLVPVSQRTHRTEPTGLNEPRGQGSHGVDAFISRSAKPPCIEDSEEKRREREREREREKERDRVKRRKRERGK